MRRGRGRKEGKGEESGGDIAEMRWRMKGGKEEGGERDRESEGSRGKRTDERTGRWEIFNTHFAKTILPRRPRDDDQAARARPAEQSSSLYRAEKKSWYVVARNFFLPLLNFSAWPCLAVA